MHKCPQCNKLPRLYIDGAYVQVFCYDCFDLGCGLRGAAAETAGKTSEQTKADAIAEWDQSVEDYEDSLEHDDERDSPWTKPSES